MQCSTSAACSASATITTCYLKMAAMLLKSGSAMDSLGALRDIQRRMQLLPATPECKLQWPGDSVEPCCRPTSLLAIH